ncbi:SERTA domain-containing protein 2-like isoform X2 [Anguilla anguilla]|nr:SERTA domain-containing protein 2-like isoform X2 [Anguilla anguilla]XP_035258482.1 SERTA domain-containing protein 2-like isoform X2 [Anguilla anguilla]
MLGKGAKRKLDEDEDGLEGKALAGLADGPSKASYTLQRQTIFNISLMKLYSQRAPPEPSLERRVLINNMLRRIQEELRQEGGPPRPLFFPASPPPDDPVDEGFREAQPAFGVLAPPPPPPPQAPPPPGPAPPDSCLTPASLLEDDVSLFCTSPSPNHPHPHPHPHHGAARLPPSAPKDSFSSALEEIEELCTTVTATMTTTSPLGATPHLPPLPPAGSDSKERAKKPAGPAAPSEGRLAMATAEPRPTDSAPPAPSLPPSSGLDASGTSSSSSSSSSSSAFLTDLALDDILFADIDTSMYDFDACTSTAGAGPAKTAPVVTADDLVKTLSPYGPGPASPVPSSQPFKMDLAELDHIMEVLVGS